jgi:hypothetical protein
VKLQGIASRYVRAVNPPLAATLRVSTGYTVAEDGTQIPTYQDFLGLEIDIQALSAGEIKHLDALNIQGIMRGVWMPGNIEGLDRPAGKGGDLLVFNGQLWLVTQVLETWDASGWCHVAVTLQDQAP